ncbi:heme biosynthesis HemY N-terminal domain-containing protein [Aliihoeflea sp. 40Bstr573]|uniref:heme biosynthesis HemY N-terminal domain-containing protein n=1 Tax=Aliihoeflea sp. 40Bstr573 TaxID=2696467 RepID=UPI002095675E|nr:heme biosynthesis HemY N-terminal domain-containing protein [Aliihoeflea sp. 40Bstr573]MCO6386982.1 heme biosynthesis protein HemY [Aliihoeflea sp. 40Bstr573]
MIRILFFLVPVFVLGFAFAWLADRPGDLTLTFGGYQMQVSLLVAAILITGVVAAVMILWWLVKSIVTSPHTISRHFRTRRRDRGYEALSMGMIAAGAGDPALARRKKKEALKLLSSDREPLVHLLDAQASLLEGDHPGARQKFEAMLDKPEMKLLGLRGLYLEAERVGDRQAARHYAERAVEAAPQLAWASGAALEEKSEAGDWDAALRLVDTQKSTQQIDRETAERRKAVLLTAKAMELLDAEPVQAKNAALEAHRLAPNLVPAAVIAAKALFRLDDLRKGAKILEAGWKRNAHPEIADAYVNARLGDSTLDRLTRAKKLQALKQNNPESALTVARAALAAGDYKLARAQAEAAIRQEPREGAYLLLADIEEAETGDQGRVRQWLGKAVRAPRDPVWVADGYVSDRWAPLSPVTGRLDAFEWRAPVERLGQVIEAGDEALAITPTLPAPIEHEHQASKPAAGPAPEPVEDIIVDEPMKPAPRPEKEPEKKPAQAEAVVAAPAAEPVAKVEAEPIVESKPSEKLSEKPAPRPEPTRPVAANDAKAPAPIAPLGPKPVPGVAEPAASAPLDAELIEDDTDRPARMPIPDDPGVQEGEKPVTESRFRLF